MTARPAFDLNMTDVNECKVFHLHGRLMDQQQADRLMHALEEELASGHHQVVLDMSQLQYMNSTGLNIVIGLLTKTRNAGGEVMIAGMSQGVRQLFLVTKLDSVFTILPTVDEAVARLRSGAVK